jgi:hypothetical protein
MGSLPGLVGLLLLVVTQIFGWVFVPMTDIPSLWEWNGPVETATATVQEVRATNTRVNGRRVRAVDFRRDDGAVLTSYAIGSVSYQPGERVPIEFPAGRPDHARIVGAARAEFPAWVLLTLTPELLVGLVLLTIALVRGFRRLALARGGTLTAGKLEGREATRMRVNRKIVFRYRFAFTTLDGRTGVAVARSHRADLLDGDEPKPILYDRDSLRALPVAALPGAPRVTDDAVESTQPVLTALVAAATAVVVLAWAALLVVNWPR